MTLTQGRGAQRQSLRTLVVLLRRTLATSWGVRAVRFCAGLWSVSIVIAVALSTGGFGVNDTSVSLVARSAAMLAILGAVGALVLAAPSRDAGLAQGIAVLAGARGFDPRRIARAEAMATVRLLAEITVLPLVLLALFVFAIAARGGVASVAQPLMGSMLFGLVAALVLGSVASICRSWGGARGRLWLIGLVLGPWFFAKMALSDRVAPYVSIPGLLGRLWEALAAVST